QRIGIDSIVHSLLAATPWWVLVGFALMCSSMLARAESWHAILRAALPGARVRRRHAVRGVMIGVLMSATLPARLGEPSRALIVARRLGRVRERLPVVLGTLVSQTLLNLVALAVLGSIMFATVGLFHGHETAVIPATPSNIGVFQAACVAVLSAYHVNHTDAFAYGVILQAVEVATAFALGMPSLVGEGMSWRDLRLRALHATPVELSAAARR